MPKITKRTVDDAKPKLGQRYHLWDTEIRGFGLLVLPSGVKSYIYQYRTADGSRRATIGKHGKLTPDQARAKADEWRALVAAGSDPLDQKRAARAALTVAELLEAYSASETFRTKAETTQKIDRGRIKRHLKPLLGRLRADALKPSDVERAFAAIRDGKTATDEKVGYRARARVSGGEGTARKAIKLLRAALAWSMREGMIKSNAADGLSTGSDGTRDTILEDADAYGRLFRVLDVMETERRIRQPVADAFRVIALTGARRSEVTGMRWRHVDLQRGIVTLPPSGHKTGRKTGKPRIIGLPSAAAAIIARQPEGGPDDRVFAPTRGDGPLSLAKPWRKVRAEAGLPDDLGLHSLRHSLASHMAMKGAQASEIMTALGHRDMRTSQKYIHWAQDARQAIAEKAASVALAGMASGGQKAEVFTIKRGS